MTIEETMRKLIRDKYVSLAESIREKATKKRIYPDSIADYYEDYYQALEDALRALVGSGAVKGFREYYNDLEAALIHEATALQREYDLRSAREHLSSSFHAPYLKELLKVVSDDDLLRIEKESAYPLPDMWTFFDDFLDKMCEKYDIPVPSCSVPAADPVPAAPEKKKRGRPKKKNTA